MTFTHQIKTILRFFQITVASLILSGCLLLSDVDVIQKGEETDLFSGDYIMSSFDLYFLEIGKYGLDSV